MKTAIFVLCLVLLVVSESLGEEDDEKCKKSRMVFGQDLEVRLYHNRMGPVNHCIFKLKKSHPEFLSDPFYSCLHEKSEIRSTQEIRETTMLRRHKFEKTALTCFYSLKNCKLLENLYHCTALHASEE